jgi:hypothetical protein
MLKLLMILPYFVEFLELPAPIVIVQDLLEVASIIVMTLRGKTTELLALFSTCCLIESDLLDLHLQSSSMP